MDKKVCTKCGLEKDIDMFVKRTKSDDGYAAECKDCHNKHGRLKYYEDIEGNRAKSRKSAKKHYHKDEAKSRKRAKEWALENPEKVKETKRNYRKNNPQKVKKWKKDDVIRRKDKIREHDREYRRKNREKLNKRSVAYRNSCEQNKIKHNLRNRIRIVLQGLRKGEHLPELIGCSIDFLKKHIESKFQGTMSWTNYGNNGWHIDHVLPCNAFDFRNETHQLACFNWRNLQPMWGLDNISKGATYNQEDFDAYMDWFIKNVLSLHKQEIETKTEKQ